MDHQKDCSSILDEVCGIDAVDKEHFPLYSAMCFVSQDGYGCCNQQRFSKSFNVESHYFFH